MVAHCGDLEGTLAYDGIDPEATLKGCDNVILAAHLGFLVETLLSKGERRASCGDLGYVAEFPSPLR